MSIIKELLYDDLINDKDILWLNFIYHWWFIYEVDQINWDEIIAAGNISHTKFLIELSIKEVWDFKYIILDYVYSDKLKILYKDIMFESSYYWDSSIWLTKHYPMIENYFFNIIDEKVWKAIDEIEIDSTSVLSIIDKYQLPVSRDLMLTKAIDKYANEMASLLNAINDADLKQSMWWILDTIKWFITPKKSNSINKQESKKTPISKKIPKWKQWEV